MKRGNPEQEAEEIAALQERTKGRETSQHVPDVRKRLKEFVHFAVRGHGIFKVKLRCIDSDRCVSIVRSPRQRSMS